MQAIGTNTISKFFLLPQAVCLLVMLNNDGLHNYVCKVLSLWVLAYPIKYPLLVSIIMYGLGLFFGYLLFKCKKHCVQNK